jgi:tRNA nucleotidyltransferase/poly(A) polymerase
MLERPTLAHLAPDLRAATLAIAQRLRARGWQAWLVGGAVRDLALGKPPKDVDFATDATPDEVQASFEHTIAVGKAFGTIIVVHAGVEAQVTTFRSERGHADARRPDEVQFGTRLEDDAARRDFTCNALYLDPLEGGVVDPTGGLLDLERRVLRTVGAPRERFAEDGLRLVRMARLAAAHGLEIEPATLAGARESSAALRGVSAERRLAELSLIFQRPASARAWRLLESAQLLDALCPGLTALCAADSAAAALTERWNAIEQLGPSPGPSLGFAVVFDAACGRASADAAAHAKARQLLAALKPSRELSDAVAGAWRAAQKWLRLSADPETPRSARIKLARDAAWPAAFATLSAWRRARGEDAKPLADWRAWAESLREDELRPAPLLTSDDLLRSGLAKGPLWKQTLDLAETLQLDGQLRAREDALRWLDERVRSSAP